MTVLGLRLIFHSLALFLVCKGQSINENGRSIDSSGSSDPAAVAAVKDGDMKALLEILHSARARGDLQQVLDEKNDNGATALQWAAYNGDMYMIDALLQSGASIDLSNNRGYTPLMLAIMAENSAVAVHLIRHGAKPDLVTRDSRSSALMYAAWKNLKEVVAALIDAGADMNLEDAHGHRAISIAEGEGNRDITLMIGRRAGLML